MFIDSDIIRTVVLESLSENCGKFQLVEVRGDQGGVSNRSAALQPHNLLSLLPFRVIVANIHFWSHVLDNNNGHYQWDQKQALFM